MRWVEALRGTPSLWDDFKATIAAQRQEALERLVRCPASELESTRGEIRALDNLVAQATAEEREEHARNTRRERETSRAASGRV